MNEYTYIILREKPELKEQAAEWFHSKWGVPQKTQGVIKNDFYDRKDLVSNVCAVYTSFYKRYGWEFLCMVQGNDEPDMTRMYIHR